MVFKLSVICLRSICVGVETGQIRGHHLGAYVSPNSTHLSPISLRQRLMDLASIRGSMADLNCITAFSSKEFLDGMSSLNTTVEHDDESEFRLAQYVRELAISMGAISRINGGGVTIGSRFVRLQLWADESDLEPIGRIVSDCPNLRALKLSMVQYGRYETAEHSLRVFSQNRVISNLDEFSIDYYRSVSKSRPDLDVLSIARCAVGVIGIFLADVQFRNLRTFCIRGITYPARINIEDWTRFLRCVQSTLVSLEVENIRFSIEVLDQLIPFPLDRLQRLRIGSDNYFEWSPEILSHCRALSYLDVPLHGWIGNEEARAIQQLNVDLAVNLRLDSRNDNLVVLNQSRFRLVDIFGGENVTSFEFSANETWNEQYIIALVDVFAACPKLINFKFVASFNAPALIDLNPLFDNIYHRYLKEIYLMGNVEVGKKILEKYFDLESLVLFDNRLIRDEDVLGWTRMGGGRRLSRLDITECVGLTYNGIVALLIASGSTLEKFVFYNGGRDEERERLREAMIKYCPFAIFDDDD